LAGGSAGSIFVDLLLRDAKYTQGLGRARSSTDKFINSASRSFTTFAKSVVAGATVGALVSLTKSAIDTASQIKDLSDRLGLSTTQLQKYTTAANLAGVNSQVFETAVSKLNDKMANGEIGYKTTAGALEALADRVKDAKTNIEAAAIANEAFGAKDGAKLLPFLKQGSEGIRQLGIEAENLGIILDAETIEKAEQFGDRLDLLGKTVKNNFYQGFLAAFVDETDSLKDVFKDKEFIQAIKDVGAALGDFVGFIARNLPPTVKALKDFIDLAKSTPMVKSISGGIDALSYLGRGAARGADSLGLGDTVLGRLNDNPSVVTDPKKISELLKRNQDILKNGATFEGGNEEKLGKTTKQLSDASSKLKKEQERLGQLYSKNIEYIDGLTDSTRNYLSKVQEFDELLASGKWSAEQYGEAMRKLNDDFKDANDKMTVYAEQAARNIQDAFADFLFDPRQLHLSAPIVHSPSFWKLWGFHGINHGIRLAVSAVLHYAYRARVIRGKALAHRHHTPAGLVEYRGQDVRQFGEVILFHVIGALEPCRENGFGSVNLLLGEFAAKRCATEV